MKKKVILIIVALIIGLIISFLLESFFREQIQLIYKWTSSNHIKFIGKNFYISSGFFYYLSFATSFAIFGLLNFSQPTKRIILNGLFGTLIFILFVIVISSFDSNFKVMECTACENGIRKLHWNDINYGLILGVSALLFAIPSLIWTFKNRRESQRTTSVNRK